MSSAYEKAMARWQQWLTILRSSALDSVDNLSGEMGDLVRKETEYAEAGGSHTDPLSPIRQWNAKERLGELKLDFDAGDELSLLDAVEVCAEHRLLLPEWVSQEFTRRYKRFACFQTRTLDETFGHRLPPGKHFGAAQKRRAKGLAVYRDVVRDRRPGLGTDDRLFAIVGRRYGLSGGTAKEYFYWCREEYPEVCAFLEFQTEILAASKKRVQ